MNVFELIEAHGLTLHGDIEHFAALVAAHEREAWEQKFARLQNLMDIREIQPNKPCCLAARNDERDRACAYMRQMHDVYSIASYPPRGTT
jgi:hypothetical protein